MQVAQRGIAIVRLRSPMMLSSENAQPTIRRERIATDFFVADGGFSGAFSGGAMGWRVFLIDFN
jgi:hypothetical protein